MPAKINREQFIDKGIKVHSNKFDYYKIKFINAKIPVTITCPVHGDFVQVPTEHIRGRGCRKCADDSCRSNTSDFIRKAKLIHRERGYDYSNVDYKNWIEKVAIKCPKHGIFYQSPHNHLKGTTCPKCSESIGERSISLWLKDNKLQFSRQVKIKGCKLKRDLPFDFGIYENSELLYLIEFNGIQHYRPMLGRWGISNEKADYLLQQIKIRDSIKKNFCEEHNIPLLIIPYNRLNSVGKYLEQFITKQKKGRK
jgi:hypothetical protein